jgi:hypothetical protein
LSGDASVKKTVDMLPAGAQWVGLASPRGTLQFVARMMSQMPPNLPIAIPEFPETSPIGFAMKLTPAGLETDLAIPTDVLQATAAVIKNDTAHMDRPERRDVSRATQRTGRSDATGGLGARSLAVGD